MLIPTDYNANWPFKVIYLGETVVHIFIDFFVTGSENMREM